MLNDGRQVDQSSLQKFQIKALKDSCKKEAYRQGHCFAKGEILWNILKTHYDNMHALHNDKKGNVGTTMMLAFDLGGFVRGMYPDESEGSAALVEQVWKCTGETHAVMYL